MKTAISGSATLTFLSCIGGLQVWPANQTHTARLDEVARIACSITRRGSRNLHGAELAELLNSFLPADGPIGLHEDPPTGPFTDIAMWSRTNFLVYPGINPDGPYVLKVLLAALLMDRSPFPDDFWWQLTRATTALLTLSNQIAARLQHHKYMDSVDNSGGDIEVPNDELLARQAQAVVFELDDLENLFSGKGLNCGDLDVFVTELGSLKEGEIGPDENPIILRPLVRIEDAIVVISPCSIVHAAMHFVLRLAEEKGLREPLAKRYRETLWNFVREYMRLLSRGPLDGAALPGALGPPVEEGLFMIDSDKAAFVQLLCDDLTDFQPEQPCGLWEHKDLGDRAQARANRVVEWLTGSGRSYCRSVLVMYVLGSMGRDIIFGVTGEAANSRTLVAHAYDLEVIIKIRECDNLTLWKFAEADSRLQQRSKVIGFDFLDLYAVYKAHGDSFYVSDKPLAPITTVPVGEARALRTEAARKADVHFVQRFGPADAIPVTRYEDDEGIPIYYPEGGMGRTLDQLVEGYAQPLWIECLKRSREALGEHLALHATITNMLSYWLWQLTPSLEAHLSPLGRRPIRIRFSLANPHLWSEVEPQAGSTELIPLTCPAAINGRMLLFEFPHEISRFLYAPDNEGERLILRDLLLGFGEMLAGHGLPNTLHPEQIRHIIDFHAPLGRKKKLVSIRTGTRASLVPAHLSSFRKLQTHDVEEQLDRVVEEFKNRPEVGELVGSTACTTVCNELVDIYLHRIKESLKEFHWESVLRACMGQHESYWHDRAKAEITTPTNIECYDKLIPQLQRFISDRMNAEHVAVALRLLIEIVSAELPAGHRRASMSDMDRLLVMAYHLINYGTLSDNIKLGILDYRLSILASGRIGVDRKGPSEVWDPFITAKNIESVEAAIKEFDSRFVTRTIPEKRSFDPSSFDEAFQAEFGLTFAEIGSFHRFFANVGFKQPTPVASLPMSQLRDSISHELGWTDEKTDTAFCLFSLKPRKKWEQAPPGFNHREDIWPWRNNRRLSYLRRPLIQVPITEREPVIFWGPRHVEEAFRNLFGLVYSGRYKDTADSSEEMKKLVSSLRDKASADFVTEVIDWIGHHSSWRCHREVKIGPGEILDATEDLGDIDVLCFDILQRRMLSVECKNVNFARNPREIRNELERFFGDEDSADSWVGRHQKRHQWLEENPVTVQAAFHLLETPIYLKSLLLTSEEIPTAYVRKMPLPALSFSRLQREGLQVLEKV